MALAYVLEEERAVIEAALWLANRKKIRSTEEVERRFAKLSLVPGVFKTIESGAVHKYEGDQKELRNWLDRIVGADRPRDRADVAREIDAALAKTVDYAGVRLVNGRLRYIYGLTGVQAVRAFGVALILDSKKGLTNRLQKCPGCGKFRLDFEPAGRPRRFCENPECMKKAEARRMRVWRKKHAKPSLKEE